MRQNANTQFNGANYAARLNHVQNSHATLVPPRRYHEAVVRTVHTAPYPPKACVRRPIFERTEITAFLQQPYCIVVGPGLKVLRGFHDSAIQFA